MILLIIVLRSNCSEIDEFGTCHRCLRGDTSCSSAVLQRGDTNQHLTDVLELRPNVLFLRHMVFSIKTLVALAYFYFMFSLYSSSLFKLEPYLLLPFYTRALNFILFYFIYLRHYLL